MTEFRCGNCTGNICHQGCSRHADKLNTYDWMADLPDNAEACNIVEVQFKPPRKGYYINANNIPLEKGDIVAVEASPGHDIGTVTMTGRLVPIQVKKANLKPGCLVLDRLWLPVGFPVSFLAFFFVIDIF